MTNSGNLRSRFTWFLPAWMGQWARDSGLLIFSQALTIVATSLSAILIARRLDPGDWGVFSALLGLSFALAVFVEFGVGSWLLREQSRLFAEGSESAEQEASALVASGLGFAIPVASLVATLGTVGGAASGQDGSVLFVLSALLVYGGLFAASNVVESNLRARRRLRRVVVASVLEKYVLVMLVALAVATGTDLWGIGAAYVIAGILRFAFLSRTVFGRGLPSLPSVADVRRVVRLSLPFALMSGALTVVPRLDALVLLAFSSIAAGYFALGDRVLAPALLVPGVAAATLFPFLARRSHPAGAIWGLSAGLGALGAVIAVAGVLLTPTLLPVVFGSQYEGAVDTVRLMLLALPLSYAANPLLAYCYTLGRERATVVAILTASVGGTGAIVTGQALAGVAGAAVGFLVRHVLVTSGFAVIAALAARTEVPPVDLRPPAATEGLPG